MDDVRTPQATGPAVSPLLRMVTLVPDASLGVARDLQRAAGGMFRFGARVTTTVVNAATRPAIVRQPLERIEAHVDALAVQGAAAREVEVVRVSTMAKRAEPMITEFLETVV